MEDGTRVMVSEIRARRVRVILRDELRARVELKLMRGLAACMIVTRYQERMLGGWLDFEMEKVARREMV